MTIKESAISEAAAIARRAGGVNQDGEFLFTISESDMAECLESFATVVLAIVQGKIEEIFEARSV